jgi:hypothetical protein
MKRAILILAVLLPTIKAFTQSQLENQYFAAWQDIGSITGYPGIYQEPVGHTWATSNQASASLNAEPSVKSTTDAYYAGNYAALIQTVKIGSINGSGTLFTGKFNLDIPHPLNSTKFGVPFTDRPVYLKGFYKYLPVNNDSCRIASWLTKWNPAKHQHDTIGAATISRQQSQLQVNTYTEFDIIYHYYSANSPDSIIVIFASSADGAYYNAAVGTKLYIDEISLEYFPLEVEKIQKQKDFLVSPNPASEYLVIKSHDMPKDVQIKIFNTNGSLLKTKKIENTNERISIADLPEGVFIYEISKPDGAIETGKFLKK